jgi:hypothetical protein
MGAGRQSPLLLVVLLVSFGVHSATAKRDSASLVQRELDRLQPRVSSATANTLCPTTATVYALSEAGEAVVEAQRLEDALWCLLRAVQNVQRTGANGGGSKSKRARQAMVWSNLAHAYEALGVGSEENAELCWTEAKRHSGSISPHIHHWHVLGPFPIGKNELDGAPWAAFAPAPPAGAVGRWWAWPAVNRTHNFYSELVDGGKVLVPHPHR